MSLSIVRSRGPQQGERREESSVPEAYLRPEHGYRPYPFEEVGGSLPEAYVWPEELRPTRSYEGRAVAEDAREEEGDEEEEDDEGLEGAEEDIRSCMKKEEESDRMMDIPVIDQSERVESEGMRMEEDIKSCMKKEEESDITMDIPAIDMSEGVESEAVRTQEDVRSCMETEEESHIKMDIPVIDLSEGVESEAVRTAIARACEEWGVFYVVNHGVPAQVTRRAHGAASRVFRLPPDAKAANARRAGSLSGFGKPHISKFYDSLMWSEGFTLACDSIATISRSLFAADAAAHLHFTSSFEEYAITLRDLSSKILGAMLFGLNVGMKQFESTQFELRDCPSYIHLNHYPPCPQPMMTIGLAPHTDSTLLTILYQGDVVGLETWKGQWKLVAPIKDSLIVHVGDLLQMISNDKYKSPLHRALVNKRKERLSVVYLFPPPPTKTLYPIHKGIDSRSLYKPLSWLDYVQAKGKYFMGALEYFKIK